MREVLRGVFDWVVTHPKLGIPVHCHYLAGSGTAIDPLLPESGLDFFREHPVTRVVLTIRHHERDAARLAEAFGCPVLCNEAGLHEFEGSELEVMGFAFGDEAAPGVRAHPVSPRWPDETALHVPEQDLLVIGDSVIRDDQEDLSFVPDRFLGDDPEAERAGLRQGLTGLLELEFDHMLLAHGPPWIGGARAALREFVGA